MGRNLAETTLVDKIRAAIDETEEMALAAGASFLGTSGHTWRRDLISCVEDADGRLVVYGEGAPTSAQADHIALHDPERELRMVRAHRTIVDEYVKAAEWCEAHEDASLGEFHVLQIAVDALAEAYGIFTGGE